MFVYKYSQLLGSNRISYEKSVEICRNNGMIQKLHLGQLKLFFSELLFLSLKANKNDRILYVGAAPGYHIGKLADLFPEIKFDLWDPRKFEIEPKPNIKIYNHFFTHDSAKSYTTLNENILLISDIRTTSIGKLKKTKQIEKMDELVDSDMKMQLEWCQIIKPKYAYLKFRLPYVIPKTKYLTGTIFLQPYTKISTETRLLTSNYFRYKIYDNIEFADKMAFHNAINRCKPKHFRKWNFVMAKHRVINNWDNAYALHIVNIYLMRIRNIKSDDEVGKLFIDIVSYHKKKYGIKYDVIFE
jgi:hypothetical protein